MWSFLQKLFTDIPVKVISSLVFLIVVLICFKPKIKISPFICKPKLPEGEPPYYQIKIVNKSWFNAFDVKVELHLLEKYSTPPTGMMNIKYETLTMKYNH